jgi:uncharacterized protein YjbJ (UPF0337 family)
MNKDQVKGTVKGVAGKVQQTLGEAVGDKSQQVKGLEKQIEGDSQKAFGNAVESIKKVVKDK